MRPVDHKRRIASDHLKTPCPTRLGNRVFRRLARQIVPSNAKRVEHAERNGQINELTIAEQRRFVNFAADPHTLPPDPRTNPLRAHRFDDIAAAFCRFLP